MVASFPERATSAMNAFVAAGATSPRVTFVAVTFSWLTATVNTVLDGTGDVYKRQEHRIEEV